jgi:hypothetical protein
MVVAMNKLAAATPTTHLAIWFNLTVMYQPQAGA